MKKFIPTILLLCVFTFSCNTIKKTKEALDSKFAPYYLIQNYIISASRNKTYIQASVYYWQFRQNRKPKYISKIEFNGTEMKKGLLKYVWDAPSPCPATKDDKISSSTVNNPQLSISPQIAETPEPTPKESDFYIVLDNFQTENTITITSPENKTETYYLKLNPIKFENPESVKISRTKNNIIRLEGKANEKRDDIVFSLTQGNGYFIDQNNTEFNPADNTIKIPAYMTKRLKTGVAEFSIFGMTKGSINTPGITMGNGFSLAFRDEICAEIID